MCSTSLLLCLAYRLPKSPTSLRPSARPSPPFSFFFLFFGGLISKLGDSVVQFFTKTKAEMTGDANTVGAGAKVLVKGLVGGTFGSAAKITGGWVWVLVGVCGLACWQMPSFLCRGLFLLFLPLLVTKVFVCGRVPLALLP